MNDLVSIIVPIYNAEKFLDRCINSIVSQTYQNIELLLIDDGSTDRSSEICLVWKKRDRRLKYIHQKNTGVSSARNNALEKAKGQYIVFVDSDDFIETYFCEEMIRVIKENNADIAFCGVKKASEKESNYISESNSGRITTITNKEFEYYGDKERREVWAAIYKSDILSGLNFPENIAVGEDSLFLAKAIQKSANITYYDMALYNYTLREESAYNGSFSEKKGTEIDAWIEISKIFEPRSQAMLSAEALCAETAMKMLGRYAGDPGFEKKYIDYLINVYRDKLPLLIKYDRLKKRNPFKHIICGAFPHAFIEYRSWKNEKKYRNYNVV